jgi:hypothetical protein
MPRINNIEYRSKYKSTTECDDIKTLLNDKNYNDIQWLHIKNINFNKEFILPSSLITLYLVNCKNTEHLGKLPNQLEYINMNGCNCFSMDHWFKNDLPNLHSIHLKMNRLNKMPHIPQNVISLDVSNNSIRKLPTENCFPLNLQHVDLSDNLLEELPIWMIDLNPDIQIKINGNKFWFSHYGESISLNKKVDINLLRLSDRYFNPLITEKLLKQMQRNNEYETFILDHPEYAIQETETARRLPGNYHRREHTAPTKPAKKTIAEQGQNVHNSDIQDSFSDCVKIIMNSEEPKNPNYLNSFYYYYILDGLNISNNLLFINHVKHMCETDTSIVSRNGVTYGEIFERIWAITQAHEHKNEIRSILREDVYNARNVCFTGKVTKLVNSLSGFVDGISVGYSVKEQINNRVIMIMRENEDTPLLIKDKVKEALNELKIPEDKQHEWLDQFD